MKALKILFADDDLKYSMLLKRFLEAEGYEVTYAGNGRIALEQFPAVKPDLVLLDINMPNLDGLKVLEIMRDQKVNSKVLFLTANDSPDSLMKAVDMGCDGYILKKSDSVALRKAIHAVYNGELYIQPELQPILSETVSVRDTAMDKLNDLTRREIDVLKLLAEGLFNKEIASRLNISERTVKNHVSNIFKKISVSDRTQAAVFAIRNNIIKISY